jgi:hypothetical protein
MAIRERLVYAIDVSADGAKAGLASIKAAVNDAEGAFGKLKAGFTASFNEFKKSNTAQAAAIGGLGAMAGQAINAASDLAESVNAVNVSYGEAAESVLQLGENSAQSFGMAKSEFNAFAVQFSSFAKNISAETGQPVAAVLDDLTTRVADFASVMNLDLNEAAAVFMSTMSGETEPIRRFGKDVSAAAVELFALKNGLIDNKSELTETIKVQARYGLLMEQTADTAGDFANTSDGLANSQRILKAEFKDMQAAIGEDLMPALVSVTKGLQNLIKVAEAVHLDDVLDTSWAEDAGRTLGTVLSPWNTGARQANEAIVKFHDEGVAAFEGLDKAAINSASSFDAARFAVLQLTGNEHAANLAAIEWAKNHERAGDVVEGVVEQILRAAHANDDMTLSQTLVNEAIQDSLAPSQQRNNQLGDMTRAQNLVQESIDNAIDSLKAEEAAFRSNVQAMKAKEDAAYGLHDAEYALETAVASSEETLADENTTLREARSAMEDVVDAAGRIAQEQLTAAGATMETKAGMDLWVESMLTSASTLKGPLRDEILRHISTVSGIPLDVLTSIGVEIDAGRLAEIEADLNFTARERFVRINPVSGGTNRYASGTKSAARGLALVGEEGPELVEFKGGETVHNAGATAAMAAAPTFGGTAPAGSVGDVTFHITMQGVNSPEGLADALNRYVRANGPGNLRRMLGLPPVG